MFQKECARIFEENAYVKLVVRHVLFGGCRLAWSRLRDSDIYTAIDWNKFKQWVKETHHKNADTSWVLRYSKEYCYVFDNPNTASTILTLNKDKRRMVMSALANLSKYLGLYKQWKNIVEDTGLKWQKRSSLDTIIDLLNFNMDNVKQWLRDAVTQLPKPHATVLVFNALTGLRPSEGCNSCKLITQLSKQGKLNDYLDRDLMMLQHFKYKDLFLRRSKNAYISFITSDLLQHTLKNKPLLKYSQVDSALNKRGFNNQMNKLRKLYATMLRKYLPREVINMLEGRVSEDLFVRCYYKPTLMKVRRKVVRATKPLQNELLQLLS